MSNGYICSPPIYEYEHNGRMWRFEKMKIGPPYWPIRKDGEPYARLPPASSEFWTALAAWGAESDQEQYRIGGGCVRW